jgi:hypothetical protein
MRSHRRKKLSVLPKALFIAVVAHVGLYFWSTTAIIPGTEPLTRRVLNTLGLSEITLSLQPPPRSATSDIAIAIRQQSSSDAPIPSALAPQAARNVTAEQAIVAGPELKVDLPQTNAGRTPLTVLVTPPAPPVPAAPRELPKLPAELTAIAPLLPAVKPPIDPGAPVQEIERPPAPPARPQAIALTPPPPAATPEVPLPAPPAARPVDMPSLTPLPPAPALSIAPAPPIALTPPPELATALPTIDPAIPLAAKASEIATVEAPPATPPPIEPQIAATSLVEPRPLVPQVLPSTMPATLAETSLAVPPITTPRIMPDSAPAIAMSPSAASPRIGEASAPQISLPPMDVPPVASAPIEAAAAMPNRAIPSATKIDLTATEASRASPVGNRELLGSSLVRIGPSAETTVLKAPELAAPVPNIAPSIVSAPGLGTSVDLSVAPPSIGGPDVLSQRSPEQRRPLVQKLGGTPQSETAVDRGVAWLAKVQEPDGRWTYISESGKRAAKSAIREHDMALTGLATLTFLAADHSPAKDGPYRQTVARAITWLIAQQGADGDLRGAREFRGGGSIKANFYDHAIATMALAEAALMTGDKRTADAAKAGARFICANQNIRTGGWRYLPSESGDTSVFGWQILALHDCEQLGFDIPPQVRDRAIHYLTLVSSGTTRTLAGYLPGEGPTPVMSAEALLCRVLLGQPLDAAGVREVTEFLTRDLPQSGKIDMYYWYYASLSLAQMQANPQVREAWDRWNTRCRDTLIATQSRDGDRAGSWSDPRWGEYGGRVFATSLATLTLEVYYRYLPMQPSDPESARNAWRILNPPPRVAPVGPQKPKFDAN